MKHSTQITRVGTNPGDIQQLTAGRALQTVTTASCNGIPASVTVLNYVLTGGPFIDAAGYRPQFAFAAAPNIVSGYYANTDNPLVFFNVGSGLQQVAVNATAFLEPCGEWDASSQNSFEILPIAGQQFDFYNNTRLGLFVLSEDLYFGFGTQNAPGFWMEQTVPFNEPGYFGVIQLITDVYAYQRPSSPDWINFSDDPVFVLDPVPESTDYIAARITIAPGPQQLSFIDAPGVYLQDIMKKAADVVAVKINATFNTFFVFNPSTSPDPNNDPLTIWYPLGGVAWDIGAKIQFDPNEGFPRTDTRAWKFQENYAEMLPFTAGFPTWTGTAEGPRRPAHARNLKVTPGK